MQVNHPFPGVVLMTKPISFQIGYISLQTGLSSHVIRAWERRYQAITPRRSKSNRRLYSESDLHRLKLLKRAIQNGHRISTLAHMETSEVATLAEALPPRPKNHWDYQTDPFTDTRGAVRACLRALAGLDGSGLHHELQRATVSFSHNVLLESVIRPFMDEVGHRCSSGSLRIVHGQLASVVVHAQLSWMLVSADSNTAAVPCLMIATPAGQHCYLGALAVALIARDQGWRAIFLGSNLPAEEIAAANFMLKPQLVALSITCGSDGQSVLDELIRLMKLVNHGTPMVIGGRASQELRSHRAISSGAVWAETEDLIGILQSQARPSVSSSLSGIDPSDNAD